MLLIKVLWKTPLVLFQMLIMIYPRLFIPVNPGCIYNLIHYRVIQNIFYVSSGILFTTCNITTGMNIALSPYINAWDLDHHILRNLYFHDTFIANFWYRAEFSLNIKMGGNGALLLTVFREELPETVGTTYQYDEDPSDPEEMGILTGFYAGAAGHASILWGIGLSYIWTF